MCAIIGVRLSNQRIRVKRAHFGNVDESQGLLILLQGASDKGIAVPRIVLMYESVSLHLRNICEKVKLFSPYGRANGKSVLIHSDYSL